MIDKIGRGWDAPHLVNYLMGPGRGNVHTNPTVIAAWHEDPGALQPRKIGDGDFDFAPEDMAALREHIHAPAAAVGLPTRQPAEGEPMYTKHGYVWHASIAISADDVKANGGPLPHETWAQIARDVMERTGIATPDDPGGCRWIAVHHGFSDAGNDHIHIAAVLVRQDTGRRFHPRNDFHAVRSVMREWEDRLGLSETAQNDYSAAREATRGEHEKSDRRRERGMPAATRTDPTETVRGQLRQAVADTAAVAGDSESFLNGLRERGLLVHLHHDREGSIDGYAVALPGDVSHATGDPIFYGGSKLSRDLSWPRLAHEWERHGGTVADRPSKVTIDLTAGAFTNARSAVQRAHTALSTATDTARGRDIAVAAHRMVAAYSRVTDGSAPSAEAPRTQAVWSSHRSARAARYMERGTTQPARVSAEVDALNEAARQLLALRVVTKKAAHSAASLELAVALSLLLAEIAAWHDRRGEHHAATAARAAGTRLAALEHSDAASTGVGTQPTQQTATATAARPRVSRGQPTPPRPRRQPPAGDLRPKGPRL